MRKIKLTVILLTLTTFALLAFFACGEKNTSTPCQHRDADDDSLCDKCGESYTDGKDVEEAPCSHYYTSTITLEPTCDGEGEKTYNCSYCESWFTEQIASKGHKPLAAIEENRVEATCIADGSYDMVVYCDECDEELSRSTEVEAASLYGRHDVIDGKCADCHVPESSEGLKFEMNTDGRSYSVVGIGSCTVEDVVIGLYEGAPVTCIKDGAFILCEDLVSVSISESVTSIGIGAFAFCYNLANITVDVNNATYKSVDGSIYTKNGDTIVQYPVGKTDTLFVIPDGVTVIGDSAFRGCGNLTSVVIPECVTVISECAFDECGGLKSIDISSGVTEIGRYAFRYCDGLESVTIGSGVTEIKYGAFWRCASLTSITIPDNVIDIATNAFWACRGLTSLHIGSGLTGSVNYAFRYCTALVNITVDESNATYKSVDGNLYSKDGKALILYAVGKSDTHFTIPEGVTVVSDYAFQNCKSLKTVTLSGSLTSIGYSAFDSCASLTDVVIPDSVTSIGSSAFKYCKSLVSVIIGNGVTSIERGAFFDCTSLDTVVFKDTSTWYTFLDEYDWENKTNGTQIDVTDDEMNVTNLTTDTFSHCIWYKE